MLGFTCGLRHAIMVYAEGAADAAQTPSRAASSESAPMRISRNMRGCPMAKVLVTRADGSAGRSQRRCECFAAESASDPAARKPDDRGPKARPMPTPRETTTALAAIGVNGIAMNKACRMPPAANCREADNAVGASWDTLYVALCTTDMVSRA